MLKPNVEQALSHHVNAEMYSAYLYLAMSGYFAAQDLNGMAGWMKVQAQEELGHALKFVAHLEERGGKAKLEPIAAPPETWPSAAAAFQNAYDHECHISGLIDNLMALAQQENDYASVAFLQGFVSEQVEEEASAGEAARKLALIGDSKNGLFMMDHQLAKRGK